jgi:membrane associated rhomboid family serine protease
MSESNDQMPVWAGGDAFPSAPGGWGWLDHRGRRHECTGLGDLVEVLRRQGGKLRLVWTPDCSRMVVPEDVEGLREVLAEVARRGAEDDMHTGGRRLAGCGVFLLALVVWEWTRGGFDAMLASGWIGGLLLLALIFGAIPWYRGWKELRRVNRGAIGGEEDIADARFETWLALQRAPVTWVLLGLMAVVGAFQLLPSDGLQAAGLIKGAYRSGDWWRLFTSPWLHGHPVHWAMNAAALLYLGRRTEVLARWPHLALAFLVSAWVGGIASVYWVAAPSVGASGGLLGLLGFLLVFETLHRRLVPVSARRRLLAGVVVIALMGLFGFRFIDNAAHAGGLVAGMAYALLVFMPSGSALRPKMLRRDAFAGGLALAVLAAGAAFACWRIM